jgi:putative peptidoglycan lipid II flippase
MRRGPGGDEHHGAAAARMGVATLTTRTIGFARVFMITAILGTTYLGNSFQASSSVSNVLFELLAAGALSAVLVPTFVELLEAGDQEEAERLTAGLLGLACIVLGAISVVGMLMAPLLARLLTTGAPAGHSADQQTELSTFFLYFFIPQVVLYAFGTVATGVLYAKRRFVITAVAPVANTVILCASLALFRVVNGSSTSLDLDLPAKLILAIGGTLGVVGFVGVPVVALMRSGFKVRAVVHAPDARLRRLLRLSSWAVLQHAGIGILLGAAIVMGNQVEGGVVAYQFAFVAFLAPYAILAQPVHTTILPALALDAAGKQLAAFADKVRWALDALALLTFPVSAAMVALALPAMEVIAVGQGRRGTHLLAAALASLALGLFPYSAFLLFARSFYSLGDSRTPAVTAVVTATLGAVLMVVGGTVTRGTARVAALGIGHTVAYLLGALVLGVLLTRRLGHSLVPTRALWPLVVSAALGAAVWGIERAVAPDGRGAKLVVLALLGLVGAAIYFGILRVTGRRPPPESAIASTLDPDLAEET